MAYSIEQKLIHVNPKTRPGTKLTAVRGVIIHWTANTGKGSDADAHFRYFDKGSVYASAHYFVDDHKILRIIPENEMAYHVGANSYKTSKYGSYPNNSLIGVEICVNQDGNFKEAYKRGVWLVADILKRYKLTINQLDRHYDITGKACPLFFTSDTAAKQYFGSGTAASAYAQFRKDVQAAMSGTSTPVAPPTATSPGQTGIVTILASELNVRSDASFTAPIVKNADGSNKVLKKGTQWKCYGEKNGLYQVGVNQWVSAGKAYASFAPVKQVPTYTVQKGDSLWGIATKYKLTVDKLKQLNGLTTDVINPGVVLRVG